MLKQFSSALETKKLCGGANVGRDYPGLLAWRATPIKFDMNQFTNQERRGRMMTRPDSSSRQFLPTRVFIFVAGLLLLCSPAFGQISVDKPSGNRQQADEDYENVVNLEIGAAANWNIKGGAATFAPNLAAETTLIERWVELEAGVSPFFTRKSTEWDTDLLFKKPWTLSRKAEFMLGIGPQWTCLKQNGKTANSIAGEVAGDFMFWPTGKHRFGWFLEPAYDYSFAGGHEQSLGISGGLLIGIPGPHRNGR